LFETFLEINLVTFSHKWSNVTRKNFKLLKNGNWKSNWKNPIILFQVFFKATFSNKKQNKINSSINQIFWKIIRHFKYLFWWKVLECFLFTQIDRFLRDFFSMVFTSFFLFGGWGVNNLVCLNNFHN
jgi:protein-S-isoprenylcysteine O-methyltransferase Ste14